MKTLATLGCGWLLFWFAFVIANICAYVHSLVFSFKHLSLPNEGFVLLVSILPPIGVIHGWLLWFGVVTQ